MAMEAPDNTDKFPPKEFFIWWKRHEHSGFLEDEDTGKFRYNIIPSLAWRVNRYREEFAKAYPDHPYAWNLNVRPM